MQRSETHGLCPGTLDFRRRTSAFAKCALIFFAVASAVLPPNLALAGEWSPYSTELLENPGFESGSASWIPSGSATVLAVHQGASNDIAGAHEGTAWMAAALSDEETGCYQDVDLSAWSSEIAFGAAQAQCTGWLQAEHDGLDDTRLRVLFFDAGGASNVAYDSGWILSGPAAWVQYGVSDIVIPAAAVQVRVWAQFRNPGTNCGACDDMSCMVRTWVLLPPAIENTHPTNVTTTSAYLTGRLSSTGNSPTTVKVYWGTSDGGTEPAAWDKTNALGVNASAVPVTLSSYVGGLSPGATYYYRYFATNGDGAVWASATEVFITGQLSLETTDPDASEVGPDPGSITVFRPATCTGGDLVVRYSLSGDALNGSDYALLTGTVTIPAGATSAPIVVAAIDDNLCNESTESVIVTLEEGGYRILLSSSTGSVTITENDLLQQWCERVKVRFAGYNRATTLNDFPALVVLSTNIVGFDYSRIAYGDGRDLVFTLPDGSSMLNYEIEEWNTNGNSYIWVRIPAMVDTNTYVWAYWSNEDVALPYHSRSDGSTWDEWYVGVWHMDHVDGASDLTDSTAYGRHGSDSWTFDTGGIVSHAQNFNGGYVWLPSFDRPYWPGLTVSAWVNKPPGGSGTIMQWDTDDPWTVNSYGRAQWWGANFHYSLFEVSAGSHLYEEESWDFWTVPYSGEGTISIPDDEWTYIALQRNYFDGNRMDFYVEDQVQTAWFPPDLCPYVGWWVFIGSPLNGHGLNATLDEVRISSIERSDDWLWASRASQGDNDSFVAFGAVQTLIVNDGATNVTPTSAYLVGSLMWTGVAPSTVKIFWGRTNGMTDPDAWEHVEDLGETGVGRFSVEVLIAPDTAYYYRCYVTNAYGDVWASESDVFISAGVGIYTIDPVAKEDGPDPANFGVFRVAATDAALPVHYVVGGTAKNGLDYELLSGTVVIPQGAASAVITVTPIDDEVFDEENDFVSITLVTGGYCLGATTQAVADIQDNDQAYKWGRFVNIRFDGYDRSPLTNFPLLVVFGPHRPTFSYADFASDEGYDLRFTAEGRKAFLNHEIEEWNTNGDSYVWVQVPVLSNGSYITAYWGNADRTNVPGFAANTWSEGYAAVWHLAEDVTDELADGTHLDSSGRENHGAQSYNGPIAGIVSGAQSFDGMNDQINCGNGADLSQPGDKTLSAWICPDTIAGERGLASKWGNSWCWVLGHDGTDLGRSAIYFDGWRIAGSVVATSAWTQVAVVYDDDLNSVTFYRNGVIDGAAVEYWGPGTDGDLTIGQRGGGASWFDGSIDETRISNVPRSSDWIWATWLNIASNDTFCAFGCVTSWGGTIIQLY